MTNSMNSLYKTSTLSQSSLSTVNSKKTSRIIGIAGRAGSGKDTSIIGLHTDYEVKQFGFADHLKQVCALKYRFPVELAYSQEGKRTVVGGKTVRSILQDEGEMTRRYIDEDFWVNHWKEKVLEALSNPKVLIVVSDCRFDNEAQVIKQLGGVIVEIQRSENLALLDNQEHPSEKGLSRNLIDHVIVNDSTVQALQNKMKEYVNEQV